jgi:hypothetical protein
LLAAVASLLVQISSQGEIEVEVEAHEESTFLYSCSLPGDLARRRAVAETHTLDEEASNYEAETCPWEIWIPDGQICWQIRKTEAIVSLVVTEGLSLRTMTK